MLTFRVKGHVWNPSTQSVEFFGDDEGQPITFVISCELLGTLEGRRVSSAKEALEAYDGYLLKIHDAARQLYRVSKSKHAYVLKRQHFV